MESARLTILTHESCTMLLTEILLKDISSHNFENIFKVSNRITVDTSTYKANDSVNWKRLEEAHAKAFIMNLFLSMNSLYSRTLII